MKSFITFKRLLPAAILAAAAAASLVQVAQAGPPRRPSRARSRYSTAARCS
jgi:anti-sigma factor RsiW